VKVRIAYTVDHEEVPRVVEEIVTLCRAELSNTPNFRFDVKDLVKTASEVANLKDKLDIITSKLEDCVSLCGGYDGMHNQQAVHEAVTEEDPQNE
jgi:hypothetical protein